MENLNLYTQIESLPEELKNEVKDFVAFLVEKKKKITREGKKERQLGLAKGLISMKPGFDDPLDDFKEYME
jgi:hypothetical protein